MPSYLRISGTLVWMVFLMLPLQVPGQSQSALDNKYDIYRERFLREFIRIDWQGDGIGEYLEEDGHYEKAGYSLPASYYFKLNKARNFWEFDASNCKNNNEVTTDPDVKKWADGTLHLGFYWTLLATEYAWYDQNGDSIKAMRTAHELYLALQAYRRLDMMGQRIAVMWNEKNAPECEYSPLYTGYSGFFVRDDVPRDFTEHWGIGGVISSLACRETPIKFFEEEGARNVVSHDQIAWLLVGLSSIKRAFPDEKILINDQPINLQAEARKIAYRMVKYVHQKPLRSIRFPECRKKKVQTGGDSFVYAFAMRRALDYIAPGHDIKSSLLDLISWEIIAEDLGVIVARWLGLAKNDNIAMYLSYCASGDMESFKGVYRMSMKVSQKEIFPMLKLWLHGYETDRLPEDYWKHIRGLLTAAPEKGTGLDVVSKDSEWRFDNRWRAHEGLKGKNGYGNGMDFMVAYNLFRLIGGE